MSSHILQIGGERAKIADYYGRLASEERDEPGYNVAPSATRDESVKTCGFKIEPGATYGFFTDTTVCIGCKACEVACKQWNQIPMDGFGFKGTSYDNTGELQATTWRHVLFIEQVQRKAGVQGAAPGGGWGVPKRERVQGVQPHGGGWDVPKRERVQGAAPGGGWGVPKNIIDSQTSVRNRWLFMSDVCKHCEHAGCMEACPTGAIVRTEFGSVLIQQDICNGCKYCVPSCPFHVITVSEEQDGTAHKCTLCYDRLKAGLEPACAKACPTDSILFGPLTELREIGRKRVEELHQQGMSEAYLYGVPGSPGGTGGVGSLNCFFLLTERPEAYNLPAAPVLPSRRATSGALTTVAAALVYGLATILTIRSAGRR